MRVRYFRFNSSVDAARFILLCGRAKFEIFKFIFDETTWIVSVVVSENIPEHGRVGG